MHETLVARDGTVSVVPETVTRLKPSEALRLGRLFVPHPLQGRMFAYEDRACALGAMIVGAGGLAAVDGLTWLAHQFPELNRFETCPASSCPGLDAFGASAVIDLTYHLNDDHEWSDDQIVSWFEAIGL